MKLIIQGGSLRSSFDQVSAHLHGCTFLHLPELGHILSGVDGSSFILLLKPSMHVYSNALVVMEMEHVGDRNLVLYESEAPADYGKS